ncbi:7SK snRNA methylphosphate capping enzyme [Bagarius yarrelli]|uniref:RNA methyltransferase n=1 Tax=Bagarius yarrelli TaxID=175774 RepID=A0A556VWX5_BAGYA|nr:7SK snRNA methylphosphate capping enzyme [Bagarius yarrelli]
MIEMSIEKETVLPGDGAAAILSPPLLSREPAGRVKALSPSHVAPVSIDTPFRANMVLAEVPSNPVLTEEAGHNNEVIDTTQEKGNIKLSHVKNGIQSQSGAQKLGKRRYSMNASFKHPGFSKRRRRANSECDPVLPSNFLLGGNIFDPLNLNSLLDEEVNQALNAETPKSSPLPSKSREPVEILIPKDITDPLNLSGKGGNANGGVLVSPLKRRRHRNRHHGGSGGHLEPLDSEKTRGTEEEGEHLAEEQIKESPQPYELNTTINCRDEVVPPILPRCRSSHSASQTGTGGPVAQLSKHKKRRRTISRSERLSITPTPSNNDLNLDRRRSQAFHTPVVGGATGDHVEAHRHVSKKNRCKPRREYHYGTYSCYYGYRTPTLNVDPRLAVFRPEWFRGKKVLDIGCNVGHVTLAIAKHWSPAHILGLDIDGGLVHAARQNLRHFLSELQKQEVRDDTHTQEKLETLRRFPVSFRLCRGAIAAPSLLPPAPGVFPNNVSFMKGNYVPDSDAVLMSDSAAYDVIVCLSVTRWVQLNWGDVGLQRLFRRENTHRNYNSVRLRPDQFSSYLTAEVGFSSYELISATRSCSKETLSFRLSRQKADMARKMQEMRRKAHMAKKKNAPEKKNEASCAPVAATLLKNDKTPVNNNAAPNKQSMPETPTRRPTPRTVAPSEKETARKTRTSAEGTAQTKEPTRPRKVILAKKAIVANTAITVRKRKNAARMKIITKAKRVEAKKTTRTRLKIKLPIRVKKNKPNLKKRLRPPKTRLQLNVAHPQFQNPETRAGVFKGLAKIRDSQLLNPGTLPRNFKGWVKITDLQLQHPETWPRNFKGWVEFSGPQKQNQETQSRTPKSQPCTPETQSRNTRGSVKVTEPQLKSPKTQPVTTDTQSQNTRCSMRVTGTPLKNPKSMRGTPDRQSSNTRGSMKATDRQLKNPKSQSKTPDTQSLNTGGSMKVTGLRLEKPKRQPETPDTQSRNTRRSMKVTDPQLKNPRSMHGTPDTQSRNTRGSMKVTDSQLENPKSMHGTPDTQSRNTRGSIKVTDSQLKNPKTQSETPDTQSRNTRGSIKVTDPQLTNPKSKHETPDTQSRNTRGSTKVTDPQLTNPKLKHRTPDTQSWNTRGLMKVSESCLENLEPRLRHAPETRSRTSKTQSNKSHKCLFKFTKAQLQNHKHQLQALDTETKNFNSGLKGTDPLLKTPKPQLLTLKLWPQDSNALLQDTGPELQNTEIHMKMQEAGLQDTQPQVSENRLQIPEVHLQRSETLLHSANALMKVTEPQLQIQLRTSEPRVRAPKLRTLETPQSPGPRLSDQETPLEKSKMSLKNTEPCLRSRRTQQKTPETQRKTRECQLRETDTQVSAPVEAQVSAPVGYKGCVLIEVPTKMQKETCEEERRVLRHRTEEQKDREEKGRREETKMTDDEWNDQGRRRKREVISTVIPSDISSPAASRRKRLEEKVCSSESETSRERKRKREDTGEGGQRVLRLRTKEQRGKRDVEKKEKNQAKFEEKDRGQLGKKGEKRKRDQNEQKEERKKSQRNDDAVEKDIKRKDEKNADEEQKKRKAAETREVEKKRMNTDSIEKKCFSLTGKMMYVWNGFTITGKRQDVTEALLITIERAEEELKNNPSGAVPPDTEVGLRSFPNCNSNSSRSTAHFLEKAPPPLVWISDVIARHRVTTPPVKVAK